MKKIILLILLIVFGGFFYLKCTSIIQTKMDYPLEAVPLTEVDITDEFWTPRMEINRTITMPFQFKKYDERGRVNSKMIQGAGYSLAKHPDPELEPYINNLIDQMVTELETIEQDRYLRRTRSGSFYEAAVAYNQATGNRKILDLAVTLADHLDSIYGPGKKTYVSGHEGLKIGLLRLSYLTGEKRYWKLAKFFLDERGHEHHKRVGEYANNREYAQDHKPVIEQSRAVGHGVRATYLYTAFTDIAALTGDADYLKALDRIWEDAVYKKTYLTGSIGSHRDREDYGEDYELPNLNGWNETCAAIGNVFWNYRLCLLHNDAKYIDVMERILYNGFLSGVSLSGDHFFYQNPLKSFGNFTRHPWFGPNCCPPNLVRLIASLGSYIYAKSGNEIYVNLFVGSQAKVKLDRTAVQIKQETRYPWNGAVKMTVEPEREGKFTIYVRIPGWTQDQPMPGDLYSYMEKSEERVSLKVNGQPLKLKVEKGFARIEREWKDGDVIELDLPMPVRKVLAHRNVLTDQGRIALERGPLVYCAEGADNDGNVLNLLVHDDAEFTSEYRNDLLKGVVVITGKVLALNRGGDKKSVEQERHELVAIPYYTWANRGEGEMAVWLARQENKANLPPVPTIASTSRASSSSGNGTVKDNYPEGKVPDIARRFYPSSLDGSGDIRAIYDQVEPINSADGSSTFLRLRPQKGSTSWVQYDFKTPTKVSSVEVYWKDDKEYCPLPESWRALYKVGNQWKPVKNHGPYGVERDKYNKVMFDTVKTDSLRLEIQLQGKLYKTGELGPPDANWIRGEDFVWYECGIIEWRVQ